MHSCAYSVSQLQNNIITFVVSNKFRSSYNRCIMKLFGFQRRDSMSSILMDLCLPTVDTVVHNSCVLLLIYALYPVIALYCGLILLVYVRFLTSFFLYIYVCIVLFYFLWTFV